MAKYSDQVTVSAAGTAVVLGSQAVACAVQVRALDTNVGVISLGNDGADDVTVSNGMRLLPGESVSFSYLSNLNTLWVEFDRERGQGGVDPAVDRGISR